MKQEEPYILSVRLPREFAETLRTLARDHQRSLHGEVVWALRVYVAHQAEEEQRALEREWGADRQD